MAQADVGCFARICRSTKNQMWELHFRSALPADLAVLRLILSRLRTEALRYEQALRPKSALQ